NGNRKTVRGVTAPILIKRGATVFTRHLFLRVCLGLSRLLQISLLWQPGRSQYWERTGVPTRATRVGWWMRLGPERSSMTLFGVAMNSGASAFTKCASLISAGRKRG